MVNRCSVLAAGSMHGLAIDQFLLYPIPDYINSITMCIADTGILLLYYPSTVHNDMHVNTSVASH